MSNGQQYGQPYGQPPVDMQNYGNSSYAPPSYDPYGNQSQQQYGNQPQQQYGNQQAYGQPPYGNDQAYQQQYQQPYPNQPQNMQPPNNMPPNGGGYGGDEKVSFDQSFKIEKPKWNDLWAGILVSWNGHHSFGSRYTDMLPSFYLSVPGSPPSRLSHCRDMVGVTHPTLVSGCL